MITATSGIVLKSPREIELMRAAGRLVHRVLDALAEMIRPGVTTRELDATAERLIRAAGAVALFKGQTNEQARFPFPASICASVNDEVVHGIPGDRPLKDGDIISVDCGVKLAGYCGDSARTFAVGQVSPAARKLLNVTQESLALALREMRPFTPWSRVARLIEQYCERSHCGVVRDFVGHGIGRDMHEAPTVPNYYDRKNKGGDFELTPGMTIAVEPMVTLGSPKVVFRDKDRWTVVTHDGSLAAHFEHTVAITPDGVDVLTDGR
jgi:methionyl aminopeptidase